MKCMVTNTYLWPRLKGGKLEMTAASVRLSCSREEWSLLLRLRAFDLREITLQTFVHISARNE